MEKGDQVEVITQNAAGSYLQLGDRGEVCAIDVNGNETWIAVDFDFEFEDAHDCDGNCINGWWVNIEDLKLL
jgi:hypothetical protein